MPTEPYLDKDDCLARAKARLASSDPADVRYAALELRMCIEAITYDKLAAYATRLPTDVLSKWQPRQAVAALLELEDGAGQEYRLAFGRTRESLQYIGEHRTFDLRWLGKHYHKLGNLLHVPNRNALNAAANAECDPQTRRAYLREVLIECERVAASSVISTLAVQVGFTCQACGQKVLANAASSERRGHVDCLMPDCGARHTVTRKDDGSLYFALSGHDLRCQSCGVGIFVPTKQLLPEHVFACTQCGRRHKLVEQVWRYAAEVDALGGAS